MFSPWPDLQAYQAGAKLNPTSDIGLFVSVEVHNLQDGRSISNQDWDTLLKEACPLLKLKSKTKRSRPYFKLAERCLKRAIQLQSETVKHDEFVASAATAGILKLEQFSTSAPQPDPRASTSYYPTTISINLSWPWYTRHRWDRPGWVRFWGCGDRSCSGPHVAVSDFTDKQDWGTKRRWLRNLHCQWNIQCTGHWNVRFRTIADYTSSVFFFTEYVCLQQWRTSIWGCVFWASTTQRHQTTDHDKQEAREVCLQNLNSNSIDWLCFCRLT